MTGSPDIVDGYDLQFLPPDRASDQLAGLRVLVLGLGSHGGGTELIRFLHSRGAQISISEHSSEQQMSASLRKLKDIPIHKTTFDGHRLEDLENCDWVVINPAIKPNTPFLDEIARSDVRPVTELGLVLSWLPARYLAAITGTNGKSTTCQLTRQMLEESKIHAVAGGNLGGSLLGQLDQENPDRRYIVEISSFQAERLGSATSRPTIVSVTNLSPDHIDWHGDEAHYYAAKRSLLESSHSDVDVAILPTTGPLGRSYNCPDRKIIRCGIDGRDGESRPATKLTGEKVLYIISPEGERCISYRPSSALEGDAGIENALHAATIAFHLGASDAGIEKAIEKFEGLPHRYQYLGEFHGIRFIDDSKATSPESAMAALNRTGAATHWLCGGQPKGSDLSSYREIASNQPLYAYCFGEVQDSLCRTLESEGLKANKFADLKSAFAAALDHAQAKDVILLSPGFASFDQFRSFEERGQHFQELCQEFQNRGSQAG